MSRNRRLSRGGSGASSENRNIVLRFGEYDHLKYGFIARTLLKEGRVLPYTSLRDVVGGQRYSWEIQEQLRHLAQGLCEHRQALEEYLSRPPRLLRGQQEIEGLMKSLRVHTVPSSQDGLNDYDYNGIIPPFLHQVDDLMANPPFKPFGREDARVLAMARWFKGSFMSWVDPIKCPRCKGPTESKGMVQPTEEEARDSKRVELHTCLDEVCDGSGRFVRYTTNRKLIRTREGRCGEWAQLFYAFLRHEGLRARYVWNSEDHVWNEYWSPALQHWVHVDSCEAAVNKSLLYDRGWGKKQNYCIAVGHDGAEDVTRAYVSDWDACLARRYSGGWSEKALQLAIAELTVACRLEHRPPMTSSVDEYWSRLDTMDRQQHEWVMDNARRLKELDEQELGGRVSGPAEWRARRSELGAAMKPSYEIEGPWSGEVTLLGHAVQTDDGVCLTSGVSQTGGVFNIDAIPQTQSFRCVLDFRLTSTHDSGAGAADGMAVVFAPEVELGLSGYGLGYSGLGSKGDFAVEIDTYRTQDHADDPPVPHISVHSPPDAHHRNSIACMDGLPYLSDGKVHTIELLYDGSSRLLRGYLALSGEEQVTLWEVRIPEGDGGDWHVGVTAACGGLWQKQETISWEMEKIRFI